MSMYIETNGRLGTEVKYWNVGEPAPILQGVVQFVQASGEELELIKRQFHNIPFTSRTTVKWTGEIARFIYENLDPK